MDESERQHYLAQYLRQPDAPVAVREQEVVSPPPVETRTPPVVHTRGSEKATPEWDFVAYLSYARAEGEDPFLSRFIGDFDLRLRMLTGRNKGVFFDRYTEPDVSWRQVVFDALWRSRVFVPLISPHYFSSTWCAREFTLYSWREQYTGMPSIIPVLWAPTNEVTHDVFRYEFMSPGMPAAYATRGLRNLARLRRKADYDRIVDELGMLVLSRVKSLEELAPLGPPSADELEFAIEQTEARDTVQPVGHTVNVWYAPWHTQHKLQETVATAAAAQSLSYRRITTMDELKRCVQSGSIVLYLIGGKPDPEDREISSWLDTVSFNGSIIAAPGSWEARNVVQLFPRAARARQITIVETSEEFVSAVSRCISEGQLRLLQSGAAQPGPDEPPAPIVAGPR
jgi:hypothetical protein